jgi:DNA topoisomerase-1
MNNEYRTGILNYWFGQYGGVNKWKTFEHNGVMFPPEYIKKNIPIIYNGKDIILDNINEEIAFLYAKYIGTEYVKNSTFNRNFWKDWKYYLGKNHEIKEFDLIDFTKMKDYLIKCSEENKTCEKHKQYKEEMKKVAEKYSIAYLDGKEQPVGNFRMEPPGIFLGRGKNPNLGKIKSRINPEDIILNIGKESKIPEPPKGHKWGKIIHDKTVEWLASWKDSVTGKIKYVWLGACSILKADSDIQKFDLAKKLKKKIKKIRNDNENNLHGSDKVLRQTATALYFVDRLALRVGNEKGKNEADTVGVTSLRVEHIIFENNNTITLDFLGKDSVRYFNKVKVDPIIYINLMEFAENKQKNENIFDLINSNHVNKYLSNFMKDLTAKVFRTYNASHIFQKELDKLTDKITKNPDMKEQIILDEYVRANAKVAKVMNHQKNISKSYKEQIDRISDAIKNTKKQLKKARESSKKNPETIKKLEHKLKEKKSKKEAKKDLKNISLDTSKVNYIDPRITFAFLKKHNIPVEKVLSKTLIKKFEWASHVDNMYHF